MSEENKALARRSWESVDDPDSLEEVYAQRRVRKLVPAQLSNWPRI